MSRADTTPTDAPVQARARARSEKALELHFKPFHTTIVLGAIVLCLAAAHALVHLISHVHDLSYEDMYGFKRFFSMGREANLPTFVSALNLLFAGGLLALIALHESRREGKRNWHWYGLAAGFILMGFDESAMIHDGLVEANTSRLLGRGEGVLFITWYWFYIPVLLALGLYYLPFLLRLPSRYSIRLALAGGIFVGGSVGGEMVEAYFASNRMGMAAVIQLFEETGEMLGVVLGIHTLLLYLSENRIRVSATFLPGSRATV